MLVFLTDTLLFTDYLLMPFYSLSYRFFILLYILLFSMMAWDLQTCGIPNLGGLNRMRIKISKLLTNSVLAVGLMAAGLTSNAAIISMTPSVQSVNANTSFYVDIMASGLPDETAGGALDISWTGGMTLDSVYLATDEPGDNGGGLFPGPWDGTSLFFSGIDSIGASSISGLYIGSWFGVTDSGDVPIARLNFTLGTSNATISMDAALLGGTWSSYIEGDFTNTYEGATVNAVPVPAALWLFGSGLIGLVGVVRRRG